MGELLASSGLWLDLGAAVVRVRSDVESFASQMQRVYGHYPVVHRADWADVHVDILRAQGVRRWIRPQVVLWCDGEESFDPFRLNSGLPLFEWGCNWMFARRAHDMLLLHAGVLERDGRALILPALPGSGKSTLTAALSQRGWRLLSDEFGAFDPVTDTFRALLKPVGLKNQSIEVIRRFAPDAIMGPTFPETRKGAVAHLAPLPEAVARRHERAAPGAVVLPKWQAGAATRFEPLQPNALFSSLAFNAFNYALQGRTGFDAVLRLVDQCSGWQLVYSDLDDALATLDRCWPDVVAHHAERAR